MSSAPALGALSVTDASGPGVEELLNRIEVDFQLNDGQPFIRGTARPTVRVATVLEMVAAGQSQQEIMAKYPKLTADDIRASLQFAARAAKALHSTHARALVHGSHHVAAPDSNRRHAKVVIVGSGPAGWTAAVYAARASLSPIVIEGKGDPVEKTVVPGGQLMLTTDVENYPGFPVGVTGPDMMAAFRQQAARFGTQIVTDNVVRADLSTRPFRLTTDDHGDFTADAVIIATGARAKSLGLDSERRMYNRGVSGCATCDGFLFRGKEVAVVGGGDTAMEEANYLTRHASKVTIIHRRTEFRASKVMVERARANPKIAWKLNAAVDEILGEEKVTGLRLRDTVTGRFEELKLDGVFIAIGHAPNTDIFKGQLDMDEVGYLRTKGRSSYTSIEGVFAAGDVQDPVYRQAVTSAGSGCTAAIDAERWLESQSH